MMKTQRKGHLEHGDAVDVPVLAPSFQIGRVLVLMRQALERMRPCTAFSAEEQMLHPQH